MALSRIAAQQAAEIKLHDWSDAPFRADRAGHRREDDSPSKLTTDQLSAAETEKVLMNVVWVTGQVLAYNDPNFDINEYAAACGIKERSVNGNRWGRGIEVGLRGTPGNWAEPGTF